MDASEATCFLAGRSRRAKPRNSVVPGPALAPVCFLHDDIMTSVFSARSVKTCVILFFDLLKVLAAASRLRRELAGARAEDGPHMGLFARAFWYYRNPALSSGTSLQKKAHGARWALEGKSTIAWLRTLSELTTPQREKRQSACRVLEKALTVLTGAQEVERFLGDVRQLELKNRAQHLNAWNLEAALKLNCQSALGRRPGKKFSPDELFEGPSASAMRDRAPVLYKASQYGLKVQKWYKEFWGEKKLAGRELEGQRDRAAEKPKLGKMGSREIAKSLAAEKRNQTEAVRLACQSPASQVSFEPMIQTIKEVAAARSSVPASSNSGFKRKMEASRAEVEEEEAQVAEPLQKSQKVAQKQMAIAKQTPAGECVPYVDAAGRLYSFKLPAPEPAASAAAALPDLVRLLAGTVDCVVPRWHRYLRAKDVTDCDVVVLADFQRDFFSPAALQARLWGKRLADREWTMKKMKGGMTLAFGTALHSHLHLFFHESFAADHPEHQQVVLEAVAAFAKVCDRPRCLKAVAGNLPEKVPHPRLSYQVVSTGFLDKARAAGQSSRILDLQLLTNRLTEVLRS